MCGWHFYHFLSHTVPVAVNGQESTAPGRKCHEVVKGLMSCSVHAAHGVLLAVLIKCMVTLYSTCSLVNVVMIRKLSMCSAHMCACMRACVYLCACVRVCVHACQLVLHLVFL